VSGDGPIPTVLMPLARTLPGLLHEQAMVRPDAPAVITAGSSTSFSALYRRASRIAAALRRDGVGRGSRIGLLSANGADWLEVFFGVSMTGAVVVPFNTWSMPAELDFLLRDSGVSILFTRQRFLDRDFAADLDGLAQQTQNFPRVILFAPAAAHGFLTLEDYRAEARAEAPGVGPSAGDDAVILYTSGSTSAPKGVRLKHYGIVENGFNIGERQGLRPDDKVFLPVPLFWSYGSANALPATMGHGAALVLPEVFEAGSALAMIARTESTAIYTLPVITNALLRHPSFRPALTRSLRTGLTIGSPRDFLTAVENLGVSQLCNVYGATETYGNCAVTDHAWPLAKRANCQGEPLPGQTIRFRDLATGEILPRGETGLAEVSGYVSPGYSGVSAALNRDIFTEDGFYRTGDIGFLNEDGCFVFVGRDSDMIKRAGINISPAEIEDVVLTFTGVSQAGVSGAPDPERGELVVAYIVPAPGASVDVVGLMSHCRGRLSKYKLPDRFEVTDNLPFTATGKLQRKELRKQAAALFARATEA
jgi:fatty-acyl-CoA synthase